MSDWKDGFNAALLKFVQETCNRPDAIEVTEFHEDREVVSYCETCGYDKAVVDISYKTADRPYNTVRWDGEFAELIRSL